VECHYRDERNRRRDFTGATEEDLQERIIKLQQEVSLWKHKYQQLKNMMSDQMQMTGLDSSGSGTTWVAYEPPSAAPPKISRSNSNDPNLVIHEHFIEGNQVVKKRALSKRERDYMVRESNIESDQEMRYYRDQNDAFHERMDIAHQDESESSHHSLPYIPYRVEHTSSPQYNSQHSRNRDDMGFAHPHKPTKMDPSLSATRNRHSAPTFVPYPDSPSTFPQTSSSQNFPPSVSVPMFTHYYENNPDMGGNYGHPARMQSEMFSSLVDAKPISQDHYHYYPQDRPIRFEFIFPQTEFTDSTCKNNWII